jgi:phosphoenolpyruvate carboxykinase (GTP)
MTTLTNNKVLKDWVSQMAEMCQPDEIYWCDGSEEEKEKLTKQSCATGELLELNQEKLPGCVLHRTAQNDVARTENLTFICMDNERDAGPTNNWMTKEEGYEKAGEIFKGSMKGRTMYVIPFSMGPIGSPFSKIGIELTDSIYVVLNMRIMTRMGKEVLDVLGDSDDFTRCLHGKAEIDIEKRLIMHFPEDNTIWSVGSGYGGNVLLGKKCLALRVGSYLGNKEGWMAEHMLILGIEDPEGNIEYVAAAFPSACGKTNLAMLIPPQGLQEKGYKVWTVGDDIAWMRINEDGRLWAVNPENGFFGVAPGTNLKSNPNAVKTVEKNTIFTNVLLKEDGTVWWEDGDGETPEKGIDWKGNPWTSKSGVPGAHPNSRFTAPVSQCPVLSDKFEDLKGVPISAVIFGGRRAHLAPLVYEAFDWQHGVFMGATMASERTAAQFGKQGEVRRDPMAMLPFCGYNMGDYFKHWLKTGEKLTNPPKIFHVNWFKKDKDDKFSWPGFGDNLRVLNWIIDRCKDKVGAKETAIGYEPNINDLDLNGLDVSDDTMEELLSVDKDLWKQEIAEQKEFFKRFGDDLPKEIIEEHDKLEKRIEDL